MALEHRRIYPFVVDELAVRPADRVLEIGCGSGAAAVIAAERATNGFVAAVDPSPVMVAQARRGLGAAIEAGRAQVVEAAAESLSFEDESFDGVLTIFSLHHWSDRKQGLSEVRQVLRPGGRLVVCEPIGGHGHASKSPVTGEELSLHYVGKLREFGFSDVECAEHEVGGRKLTIIKARRES
jgi:ubiquinone/menaquinone biosynthesis C-methylase UbiE